MIPSFPASHHSQRQALRRAAAFSLVEVTLAIGIVAFALIPIVALLPVGLKSAGDSTSESQAVNLLNSISADRLATPYTLPSTRFNLPALSPTPAAAVTGFFGIADDEQYVAAADIAQARYRITYRIVPPAAGRGPLMIHYRASWPAQNTAAPEIVEVVVACRQP